MSYMFNILRDLGKITTVSENRLSDRNHFRSGETAKMKKPLFVCNHTIINSKKGCKYIVCTGNVLYI